jgi:hypothetical protein
MSITSEDVKIQEINNEKIQLKKQKCEKKQVLTSWAGLMNELSPSPSSSSSSFFSCPDEKHK